MPLETEATDLTGGDDDHYLSPEAVETRKNYLKKKLKQSSEDLHNAAMKEDDGGYRTYADNYHYYRDALLKLSKEKRTEKTGENILNQAQSRPLGMR